MFIKSQDGKHYINMQNVVELHVNDYDGAIYATGVDGTVYKVADYQKHDKAVEVMEKIAFEYDSVLELPKE